MRATFIRNQMPFAERKEVVRRRHHVRHQLRVRLRLPARQHGDVAPGHRPAQPCLRDRRRGRLDPHRRGADAAHHLRRAGDGGDAPTTTSRASSKELEGVPAKFVPKGMEKTEDDGDYEFDEKFKTVSPRETAIEAVERALGIENLYDPRNAQLVNHLIQALKAESLYQRDVDYVVQDGEVKIVDEFTGRIMEGRRWSEGLHQAVEAKEGVAIREEHVTLATITLQNYFRLYEKLCRHDRHGEDGGEGVPGDLQPLRRRDPDERPGGAGRRERLHLQDARGEVQRRHRRHQGAPRGGPARPRRDDLGGGLGVPLDAAHARRHHAQRPEREAARARGGDHQGRGRARRRHDRDEHGRPRRRHQARRGRPRARRALRARHRAARGAPHRQPAARPLRPPGRSRASLASTSPPRTTSSASSPATGSTTSSSASSSPTTSRWRRESSRSRSRTPRRRSRSRTSSRARTSSSTTTS